MTTTDAVTAGSAESYLRARGGWLVRCAHLLTSDREAALDLAQETAVRLWRSWERVEAARDVDAYVMRVMVNALRSQHRRRRVREVPLHEAGDPGVVDADGTGLDVEVAVALERLPERQRQAVVLRYWADLDDRAIAAALGCRPATVRSLLSRAVRAVRNELEGDPT